MAGSRSIILLQVASMLRVEWCQWNNHWFLWILQLTVFMISGMQEMASQGASTWWLMHLMSAAVKKVKKPQSTSCLEQEDLKPRDSSVLQLSVDYHLATTIYYKECTIKGYNDYRLNDVGITDMFDRICWHASSLARESIRNSKSQYRFCLALSPLPSHIPCVHGAFINGYIKSDTSLVAASVIASSNLALASTVLTWAHRNIRSSSK